MDKNFLDIVRELDHRTIHSFHCLNFALHADRVNVWNAFIQDNGMLATRFYAFVSFYRVSATRATYDENLHQMGILVSIVVFSYFLDCSQHLEDSSNE